MTLLARAVVAQDTTQAYPWRMSDFPYLTASPNDGVMGVARAVWFRQSRWDDRVSVADQVAIDAGYSTRDAWLVRARGDFPRLAPGWRLQVIGDALKTSELEVLQNAAVAASRQSGTIELTRTVVSSLMLAVRGGVAHTDGRFYSVGGTVDDTRPANDEMDWHVRVAAVLDRRDREYDTRSGLLLQGGVIAGHYHDMYRGALIGSDNYTGWYSMAAGWIPLPAATTLTARVGARALSQTAMNGFDAPRTIPAWEDDILAFGGPESNRGLPIAAVAAPGVLLAGAELRHDLFVFPGGAVTVLAFIDGGRAFEGGGCDNLAATDAQPLACRDSGTLRLTLDSWTVAPGGGIALRLLRNAVLTATVARAEHATRVYVSSGWSW